MWYREIIHTIYKEHNQNYVYTIYNINNYVQSTTGIYTMNLKFQMLKILKKFKSLKFTMFGMFKI